MYKGYTMATRTTFNPNEITAGEALGVNGKLVAATGVAVGNYLLGAFKSGAMTCEIHAANNPEGMVAKGLNHALGEIGSAAQTMGFSHFESLKDTLTFNYDIGTADKTNSVDSKETTLTKAKA